VNLENEARKIVVDFCNWWKVGKDTSDLTNLHRRELAIEELASLLKHVEAQTVERAARVADQWGRDRGMQFGCDGQHRGRGTKDCPKELHHHHDDRCESPGQAIRNLNMEG